MTEVKLTIGALVLAGFAIGHAAQMPAADAPVPGIIPSGFGDAIDRDVARIRTATARFKSSEAAESAGYPRVTDCVEYQPHGAMGYHFQNNTLLDTTLDVEHPEVLVYERTPDGTFKLNGVEFLVPIPAWTASEPPTIMGQTLKRADKLGIWYLHVWTWKASPNGLFSDWNPHVKCDAGGSASAKPQAAVAYPDGFRGWTHVKSLVVGPDHQSFSKRGGVHHYYANAKALEGYGTGSFPDGSIVVDEAVFMKDGEGPTKGLVFEGDRRFLDVMVKDRDRYGSTGGWGYEHFDGSNVTGGLSGSEQAACSACHEKAPTDHVFSRIRP